MRLADLARTTETKIKNETKEKKRIAKPHTLAG
jgi:hypothetical protein